MHSKKINFFNFSRAQSSESFCFRPDKEQELFDYMAQHPQQSILVRGSGLSYNDSCFNTNGFVIDTSRLNHFISFDPQTGLVICQGGVSIGDLFLLHPDFIPPVIPGTLKATVAGGIAHDVHGKNNHKNGSFGGHILWLELLIRDKKIRCSAEENQDLFYATIGGLGLTGIITRAALFLQKKSTGVSVSHKRFSSLQELAKFMASTGLLHDYQVAWIDFLHKQPNSILSLADHCEPVPTTRSGAWTIPKIPFSCVKKWNIQLFNRCFFSLSRHDKKMSLQQFNNPLDKITHWNRLYGPHGLVQFQALIAEQECAAVLEELHRIINDYKATPTLAVLKLFTLSGNGLISFCKPGFTIAIDFIHNKAAQNAIKAMNQLITEAKGRVYLAKDNFLTAAQYEKMYENHQQFSQVLHRHQCTMRSDLAQRLGILI